MLYEVDWAEDGTYAPQGEHTPVEFFNNALNNSVMFDIQLGYFNSAAINVLSRSFATFIKNGGYMRMAINQIVSQKDKVAIGEGVSGGIDAPFDLADWESIHKGLDEYGEHFFHCLAYLIQEKRIEIQIIKPKATSGIAHTKRGQFTDKEGMVVGFSGSANFTLGGLFNNLENIEIFLSTSPDKSIQKKIHNNKMLFSRIMNKKESGIEYLDVSDLESAITSTYGHTEIEELLDVEKKLRRYKQHSDTTSDMVSEEIVSSEPCFPFPNGPRDYQKQAFENWKNNNQKGLFAMATGTGKTLTALNCLLEIYKRKGYYKAIILVPTITLVNQWEQECRKFNFAHIIKVYSKNLTWKKEIERLLLSIKVLKKHQDFIIITTYTSFANPTVFGLLNNFERNQTLLIADECHNLGSPKIARQIRNISYLRRIGLSATPERQYDDDCNKHIFCFFGAEDKYTYEYSMKSAIENGVLCRYLYYPHVVSLNDIEMQNYLELSKEIATFYDGKTDCFPKDNEILKALLLARKRIIHKASNKLHVFEQIIKDRYNENGHLKYTLVYAPEGCEPNYEEDSPEEERTLLIDLYSNIIINLNPRITLRHFTAGQKDRTKVLDNFAKGDIQVLVSMKCLDEGVDVPRSELAIFCASTGNPRQFIQRRGRILRKHPDKHLAVIHDLVVVPFVNDSDGNYKMERNLLKQELLRVRNFALLSENSTSAIEELSDVMNYYSLNIYNNESL